ncbi:relaxase/mobilization nuclease family protein [Nostoc commune NIES-4072]|uniref:Relaxase/mobilization nuclease family protein n=1 Tax=Nostoc commune NIES-4072 TaxID=2005467 RepID=A0A2R5G6F9_NOSCO|nr:relaxase/mobilization nuclease domain-containing protein [Nostoc commune]BBD70892.1 relaxase/mobilization nuclease family protein [Nostoc commune HK-02]GBG23631.1 relaxase/mobilization nuclease family protein [Nostoc commune NIES-4072]
MIGNQTKGKSFRGLLDYLENKEESSLIGGNMFGTNARELAREFRLSRQLNPEAEKVVHHVSLSLSPGEQLDNDTWCEIADKYIEEMGYTANQYAIYHHSDRNHDHIHICASRISLDDGKITRDSWEYVRSEKIIRQLELEYGLQQTLNSKEKLNRAPSVGQQRRVEREQLEYEQGERNTPPQQPIKTQLIELIDRATVDKPTMPQLMERLQLLGIEMRHGLTRNGKSKGISYSWNDQKFSGTSLGPAYTFPGLQKHRGIDYQPERDDERINQILVIPAKPLPIEQLEKFLQEIERKQQPQFTPPPEDKVVWQVLHKYLDEKRYIPDYIVQGLHNNQLLYMDEQRNILFIKRDLDGEKTGALVWSKPRENHRTVEYDQNTSTQKGWFYLRLGGQPTDKVENVFLCSTPIDAMSAATYLISSCKGLPPTRTMLMVADDPNNLPMEFLKSFNRVVVAFNNDSQGNLAASAVLELLPQGKRLKTHNPDWSQELEAHLREEQQKQKQLDRGFSL